MKVYRASVVFCCCAMLCRAQTVNTDQALLNQMRGKYDAPFTRNLQSFDCAVDFSWKDHFKETFRVGDEGTDEELETIFQPIRNRVTVTRSGVAVSAVGLTDTEIAKLPHGGMAEELLEHAVQKSLETWFPASLNVILPVLGTPVSFKQSKSGYNLDFKAQNSDIEMVLDSDMRLQGAKLIAPQSDHFEMSFEPGPQGFLLKSWTIGEDGNWGAGHRLIFTYTYQTVDGVQLPEHVAVIRESHHEVWHYTLSDCSVKKTQ